MAELSLRDILTAGRIQVALCGSGSVSILVPTTAVRPVLSLLAAACLYCLNSMDGPTVFRWSRSGILAGLFLLITIAGLYHRLILDVSSAKLYGGHLLVLGGALLVSRQGRLNESASRGLILYALSVYCSAFILSTTAQSLPATLALQTPLAAPVGPQDLAAAL